MEKKTEPLIPKLLKNWKFKKQFTALEWEELNKIKKKAFIEKMRILAKKEGEKMAEEHLKEGH